jgi:SagB-type dehydrogenase family enzyme
MLALDKNMLEEAPASIIFSAVYDRTTSRYGTRGEERYVCMDLGHAAQNTYLQATAMGMGTCAVGAFDDKMLQQVLQLPPEENCFISHACWFCKMISNKKNYVRKNFYL